MSFTKQDYDLRKTFSIEKKLLLFAGFYPKRTSRNNYLYFFGRFVNLFFSCGQLIAISVQLVIDRNDFSKISESLQYFITHVTFMCKLTNFVIYKQKLLKIEDALESETFYGFSHHRLQLLKDKISSALTVAKIFRVMIVVAVVSWGLPPYLDGEKASTLPTPGWFPYNVTKYYHPTFAYQILGIANDAYTNSTIDILTWILICIASGQFEILKENLKDMDYGRENVKQTEENFKKCIKHHKEIVKFVYEIENMFSRGIFVQFFASVIVICFIGFMMIIVPMGSMQFYFLIAYFGCMMLQVAMYCWYGHDVMTTSNKIGEFLFSSNWYESDLSLRKNIIIFMERTKKPVTLTAGKFVTLSLSTLTGILKSSYSYFAVLRRMYTDS